MPTPYELLLHQIEHYSGLQPINFEHKVFLRKQLYQFNQQLKLYA